MGGKTMEKIAKYAYHVYKTGSFTKAAKELYVSQPSLSAAISRLEGDLGFRIFDRSTNPCSLTAEGRIYIESLEEICESESNMQRRIKELSDVNSGKLVIGGSSYTSYMILSEICSEFYNKYPCVSVTLDIGNVGSPHVLDEKLDNKDIDIIITYKNDPKRHVTETLFEERMVIALHKSIRGAEKLRHLALTREEILQSSYSPDRELCDMSVFSDIEFLDFSRQSDTQERMVKLLGSYKSSGYSIQNARHSEMHYNLMCAGIGALLTTSSAIAQKPYDENILFFMPKSEESYRKIYLAYNFSSRNNPLIKNFIKVAKGIYSAKHLR